MKIRTILICLLFNAACTKTARIPPDIFPKEKMENVMWDMMLADRYSNQYLQKDSASKNVKLETMKLYEEVFQLNNTNRSDFVKSYKYYLSRPDILKTIFDSLAVRGTRNRDVLFKKE